MRRPCPFALTSGAEGSDDQPVWSPDGKKIAFLRMAEGECSIQVMPALGGQARRVGYCSTRTLDYIDWYVRRPRAAASRAGAVRAPVARRKRAPRPCIGSRSTPARIEPIDYEPQPQGEDDLQPRVSPDGRWIAFRRGAVPYSDLCR